METDIKFGGLVVDCQHVYLFLYELHIVVLDFGLITWVHLKHWIILNKILFYNLAENLVIKILIKMFGNKKVI